MTQNPLRNRAPHIHAMAMGRLGDQTRRQALENLRRLDIQLQIAAVLDRRAELSANRALAGVLHERAEERRRIAGIIHAHLLDADASADWLAPVRPGRPAS